MKRKDRGKGEENKSVFPKVEVESDALVSKGGTKELFSPFSVSVMKLMDDLKTAR